MANETIANETYLTFEHDGAGVLRPTLWDRDFDGQHDVQKLRVVRFKDGSIGLLPEAQATAIEDVLNYLWQDEINHWNQTHAPNDSDWLDEPLPPTDDDMEHVIHPLAALRLADDEALPHEA